jgi:hypothetical protein
MVYGRISFNLKVIRCTEMMNKKIAASKIAFHSGDEVESEVLTSLNGEDLAGQVTRLQLPPRCCSNRGGESF